MRNVLTPGMRYMLLGTFLFSIGSLLIKVAGERVPTMELLFFRGVVGLGFCYTILRRSGVSLLGHRRLLLATRGLVGFLSLFTEFYALVHLPLADATAIIFTHPAVVALLAWAVLGERLGRGGIMAVAASLAGVALVCRPGFLFGAGGTDLDPLAVSVALGGVLVTALAILSVRALAKTEHPAVVMFYPPLLIVLFSPLFSGGWVMPTPGEWACVAGIALAMNAGQYYMTRGYAIESAARISAVTCLEMVFAAMWGITFLAEIPDTWTLAGGSLIVFGVLLLGREGQREAEAQSAA
ncbi:EamA family transporter [Pseudodesulfovibrio cashew]|uniref:EamA family transporter n=1 Tax=Pseudodesulfovibrio cashew TaxID=2678688 RepID=A0A6I6JI31_9BACT|nr:DMT family transporter [Pseudodesulfovibrio cashew]QGY39807.1 EamA family transporter [Pseudodesulfovibrio cashew]